MNRSPKCKESYSIKTNAISLDLIYFSILLVLKNRGDPIRLVNNKVLFISLR